MDFLDPELHRRHIRRLFVSYGLVSMIVLLSATMLFFMVNGLNLSRSGEVIYKGLIFLSSAPGGADVYVDGVSVKKQTNTRLNIPEGSYELQLQRPGYRTWQRHVVVRGGTLVRYDYPVLFPETLTTETVATYKNTQPGLGSVSIDHRWLLIQRDASTATFDLYDTTRPTIAPITQTLPPSLYAAGGTQRWQEVAWADDNRHLILKHSYGLKGSVEFVLYDSKAPQDSVNLSQLFESSPSDVRLVNSKYDSYYLYSKSTEILQTASLTSPTPQKLLDGVLSYDTYQRDYVLYVTKTTGGDGHSTAVLRLRKADQTYTVSQLPDGTSYSVALTTFSGDTYVAAAAKNQPSVSVYKNPIEQASTDVSAVSPLTTIRLSQPSYLSFSPGGQLLFAQSGQDFVSYNLRYKTQYRYSKSPPVDAGQAHATWMDGAHLQYVSNGQLYVFDYDGTNPQILIPSWRIDHVFYTKSQKVVYTLVSEKSGGVTNTILTRTPLRTPADQ